MVEHPRAAAAGHARRQPPAALALIDPNDVKGVNDGFGHRTGDRVLHNLARHLGSQVSATDLGTRPGGDESAVILTHVGQDAVEARLTARFHGHDHRMSATTPGVMALCQVDAGVACIDVPRPAGSSRPRTVQGTVSSSGARRAAADRATVLRGVPAVP